MARFLNSYEQQLPTPKRGRRMQLVDDGLVDDDDRPTKRVKSDGNGKVTQTGTKGPRGTKNNNTLLLEEVIGPDIVSGVRQRRAHKGELEFCANVLVPALMNNPHCYWFLKPVRSKDCPDYHSVISHPMDFGSIKGKLTRREYNTAQDCCADIELVFSNARIYNQAGSDVYNSAGVVEAKYKELVRQMVEDHEDAAHPGFEFSDGEAITNVTSIRISEPQLLPSPGRPSKKSRDKKGTGPTLSRALVYCKDKIIRDMLHKKHYAYSWPFLEPVDPVKYNCPDYYDVIHHPMDLKTIKIKLSEGQYTRAKEVEQDIRLMFNNCYKYNPALTEVHKGGRQFETIFNQLWAGVPPEEVLLSPIEEVKEKGKKDRTSEREREKQAKRERKAQRRAEKVARRNAALLAGDASEDDPGTIIKLRAPIPTEDSEPMSDHKRNKDHKLHKEHKKEKEREKERERERERVVESEEEREGYKERNEREREKEKQKEKEKKRRSTSGGLHEKHRHRHKERDQEKEKKKKKKHKSVDEEGVNQSVEENRSTPFTQDDLKLLADDIERLPAVDHAGLVRIVLTRGHNAEDSDGEQTLSLDTYDDGTLRQLRGYVTQKLQQYLQQTASSFKTKDEKAIENPQSQASSRSNSVASRASLESDTDAYGESDSESDSDYNDVVMQTLSRRPKSRAGSIPPKSPRVKSDPQPFSQARRQSQPLSDSNVTPLPKPLQDIKTSTQLLLINSRLVDDKPLVTEGAKKGYLQEVDRDNKHQDEPEHVTIVQENTEEDSPPPLPPPFSPPSDLDPGHSTLQPVPELEKAASLPGEEREKTWAGVAMTTTPSEPVLVSAASVIKLDPKPAPKPFEPILTNQPRAPQEVKVNAEALKKLQEGAMGLSRLKHQNSRRVPSLVMDRRRNEARPSVSQQTAPQDKPLVQPPVTAPVKPAVHDKGPFPDRAPGATSPSTTSV
eukprot:Ihof_evm11s59 gene=Ihof_evmTU11s59